MNESKNPLAIHEIAGTVADIVGRTIVTDMHTHLFPPQFGPLNLWGIDALLTYHYLIAELFRVERLEYSRFWSLSRAEQADLIWRKLFVERAPISEAAQGVVRVLSQLGLDPCAQDLTEAREFFSSQDPHAYAERVLDTAGVDLVVMTNDPLDPQEEAQWQAGVERNSRYAAALRLDMLLTDWPAVAERLTAVGEVVNSHLDGTTAAVVRRFLSRHIEQKKPLYLAASLPADFAYPDDTPRTWILREVVLPTCLEYGRPMALMIGVRRQVNPHLRLAGDGVGRADVTVLERLASEFPDVYFLVTMLSRENQHELCVVARKFGNVVPFGCWWFLNNPSLVTEMTRMRLEMLGATFVAQHSDARVLDQLLYKWPSSREVIAAALAETYKGLARSGRPVTRDDITADVERLFRTNFRRLVGLA